MSVITKPILYLLLVAIGIVGTAYFMERRADKKEKLYQLEIARLEGENRLITQELQKKEAKRLADKQASEIASSRERAIREKLQQQDAAREKRIRQLERERSQALADFHHANTTLDTLPHKELGESALASLSVSYPEIAPLQLTPQPPDSYVADIPFVRASARAGVEVAFLRFETEKQGGIITELQSTQNSLTTQIDSHTIEKEALLTRCLSCEDALATREQLEANLQQTITLQAARMKELESRNLWGKVKRLEIPGGVSLRDVGIGYGVRALTE